MSDSNKKEYDVYNKKSFTKSIISVISVICACVFLGLTRIYTTKNDQLTIATESILTMYLAFQIIIFIRRTIIFSFSYEEFQKESGMIIIKRFILITVTLLNFLNLLWTSVYAANKYSDTANASQQIFICMKPYFRTIFIHLITAGICMLPDTIFYYYSEKHTTDKDKENKYV